MGGITPPAFIESLHFADFYKDLGFYWTYKQFCDLLSADWVSSAWGNKERGNYD
jgi:hypothetical protein